MKSVILDTSTLLDFCQIKNIGKEPNNTDAIHNAIESLVLYDHILYDQKSVENILEYGDGYITSAQVEKLQKIANLGTPIDSYDFNTSNINESILTQANTYIKSNLSQFKKTNIHPDVSSILDDFEDYIYPDNNSFYYNPNHSKPVGWYPPNQMILEKYVKKYGVDTKYFSQTVVPHLVRIFYYQFLQNKTDSYYVPHPFRNSIFLNSRNQIKRSSIIDAFKEKIVNPFILTKRNILGLNSKTIEIPLLSNHLLKRVTNFDELINEIEILRNHEYSVKFREAIGKLESAEQSRDDILISTTLDELEHAMNNWKITLGKTNISRNIKTCQVDHYDDFNDKLSVKLLTFVHYVSNS